MIIATAGHVDHGKTSLVKALTGVDTDGLAEEQRRGMSIDLGFAYARLDERDDGAEAEPVGFIDVPGHERFVRNMLAGVAAIDLALLVVAADDGPMPQTREHLAILTLLGVPALVLALSKIDRVSPQRLLAARAELAALLADGPYASAPVFALATPSGVGVAALRGHLAEAASQQAQRRAQAQPAGCFRLAIDRSFSRDGAGRIVTGAVLSGRVQVGDSLLLAPQGISVRVRGLMAQSRRAEWAQAGQRCAINLAGADLKRTATARGDWLLSTEAAPPSDRLDVQLQILATEARPLSQRATLQLHVGAAAVNVRVAALGSAQDFARGMARETARDMAQGMARGLTPAAVLDATEPSAPTPPLESVLAPGRQALVQLLLDRPVAAAWGDRFILRDPAANRTIGGGRVIAPASAARGRSRPQRLQQLAALAHGDAAEALAAFVQVSPDGADLGLFHRARNHRADEAAALQHRLGLHIVATPDGPLGLTAAHWQCWRQRVCLALARCHADQPDSLGPESHELRAALGGSGGAGSAARRTLLQAVLSALVSDGQVQRDGLRHRLIGHRPLLADDDAALLARVLAQLQPAGLRPPIVGELATALALPLLPLLDFLARMAQRGLLVRVAPNRFYPPETVAGLISAARALAGRSADASLDAAAYRDSTGIGRNLTVQVLEFLNRAGLTRFDGRRHRLLS